METRCTSCKLSVINDKTAATFICPVCGEGLVRCGHCRKTAVAYKCPKCGFEGP